MKKGFRLWRRAAIVAGFWMGTMAGTWAQTIWTGNPAADSFVTTGPTDNLSGSNYGAAGALGISGTAATRSGTGFRGVFDTVIRFDLANARSSFDAAYRAGLWTVQSITLRLTTTSANNAIFNNNSTGQFSIAWMQNDGWAEGSGSPNAPATDGITYTSLPGFLGARDQSLGTFTFDASTSGSDGFNSTYVLSLGSGIIGDALAGGLASFQFAAVSDAVSYLFNSENFTMASRRPLLTITAVAVPEPSVCFLLFAGIGLLLCITRSRGSHAS